MERTVHNIPAERMQKVFTHNNKSLQHLNSTIQKIVLLFFIFFHMPIRAYAQVRDWASTGCIVDGIPTLKCLEVVFTNLLFISNIFVALAIFVMFTIGSFQYLTSLGAPEKIDQAKGTFKWTIIGLMLYLSAYLILTFIDIIFLDGKGDIFRFRIGN